MCKGIRKNGIAYGKRYKKRWQFAGALSHFCNIIIKTIKRKENTPFQYYFVSIRFVTTTNFYIFAQLLHYNNYIIFGIMMNKNQIGTNAGIVWKLLSDNAHWEYDKLKQASGLSDRDLNAAIGWLAREDKIDFDIDEQHDRLFLHVNVYIG